MKVIKQRLNVEYDKYAKLLADLQKGLNVVKKKLMEMQKDININANRLVIYITNQFDPTFKFNRDTLLFRKDFKIEIHTLKEVELAKKKFEEFNESVDDAWLLDELDLITNETFAIVLPSHVINQDDKELEPFYQLYDDIKQYLPKTNKIYDITLNQRKQLKDLIFICKNPQYQYLIEKLEAIQENYLETVDEVLDKLEQDKHYFFDIINDSLITKRDDKDLTWHLVIAKKEP